MAKADSFYNLQPEIILEAVEQAGFFPTGRMIQLNSYENRVFDIFLENGERIISKFYRPTRWSKEAILEEHEFLADLFHEGVKAVPPLKLQNDSTIDEIQGLYFCFFNKYQGRMPDEFLKGDLKKVGRTVARIHNVGAQKEFQHRWVMNTDYFGDRALDILVNWVEPTLWNRYEQAANQILDLYDEKSAKYPFQRIHGDCHRGNLLSDGEDFSFIDFDDSITGPIAQDFWMLIGGNDSESLKLRDDILSGYEELRSFDYKQLELLELLRGMRIISYASWIGARWLDPSFPRLFPQYREYNYWAEEIEALERIAWRA